MPRRKEPERKPERYRSQRRSRVVRLGEAVAPYAAQSETDIVPILTSTRLSSKNQITLPVAVVRRLGLRAGDEVDLTLIDDVLRVRRKLTGDELLDWLQGSMAHVPEWSTKDKIHQWINAERDSWARDRPSS